MGRYFNPLKTGSSFLAGAAMFCVAAFGAGDTCSVGFLSRSVLLWAKRRPIAHKNIGMTSRAVPRTARMVRCIWFSPEKKWNRLC